MLNVIGWSDWWVAQTRSRARFSFSGLGRRRPGKEGWILCAMVEERVSVGKLEHLLWCWLQQAQKKTKEQMWQQGGQ